MRWSWDQRPITINKNMKNFKKTNRLERCLAQNFVSFMYLSATINSFSCGRLAYIRDFGQLAHVFFSSGMLFIAIGLNLDTSPRR